MSDPLDLREAALGAAFAKLRTLTGQGAALVARLPTFRIDGEQMPALVMLEAGEDAERLEVNTLQIATDFDVVIMVKADEADELGPLLNLWRGRVRALFGADPTLGGTVSAVLYQGCQRPGTLEEPGSGHVAALPLHFSIERWEAELDPFSAVP